MHTHAYIRDASKIKSPIYSHGSYNIRIIKVLNWIEQVFSYKNNLFHNRHHSLIKMCTSEGDLFFCSRDGRSAL